MKRIKGRTITVEPTLVAQLHALKKAGDIPRVAREAKVDPNVLHKVVNGISKGINEHSLRRVQRVLNPAVVATTRAALTGKPLPPVPTLNGHVSGHTVPLDAALFAQLAAARKVHGGVAQIAAKAGIRPQVIRNALDRKYKNLNEHYVERIRHALAGTTPPKRKTIKRSRLPAPALPMPATPAPNEHWRSLVDGFVLAAQVMRQALLEHAEQR